MVEVFPVSPGGYAQSYRESRYVLAAACNRDIDEAEVDAQTLLAQCAFESVRDDLRLTSEQRALRILRGLEPHEYDAIGIVRAKRVLGQLLEIADTYGSERILRDEYVTDNLRGEF